MHRLVLLYIMGILGISGPVFGVEPMAILPPRPMETPAVTAKWFYSTQAFDGGGMACFSCHAPGAPRQFSRKILKQRERMLASQVRLCIEAPDRVSGQAPSDDDIDAIVATIRQIYGLPPR